MKTDDLITLLARDVPPVQRHAAARQLALALAAAVPLSLALLLAGYGLRPTLAAELAASGMAWAKLLLPTAVAVGGAWLVTRLGRPGMPAGRAWLAVLLPVLVLWGLGAAAWLQAPEADRAALLWGRTWRSCPGNILLLGAPVLAGGLLALRAMAPLRPARAGAAAGLLAGGAGATVYALHCPELAAPFLAVWYVAGMGLAALAGALIGARLLRW